VSESGARRLIEPQLWTGEELLWCDQPVAAGPVASAAARKGFYGAAGAAAGTFIFIMFVRGAFRDVDPQTSRTLLIVAGASAGAVLAFGAISAWSRARRLVHLVAYGVSNRRIIMVQGEDVHWVGAKEPAMEKAEAVARELTLAALPNPEQVAGVIQTLLRRSAS